MQIDNIRDSLNYLMRLNLNDRIIDSIDHSWDNVEWYEAILQEVLKLSPKPKRVVDIGSNLNQYGYLFVNEGIEYIGVDHATIYYARPIITDKIKFIGADYNDVKEIFKDDVIISCLCVGYQVSKDDVKATHLITNGLENGKPIAVKDW